MVSLQEQMLKAGLVNKDKAKKVKKDKQKQTKSERKSKEKPVDEIRVAVEQEKTKRMERDRELNRQKQKEAQVRATESQIRQLIEMNKVDRSGSDISYGFIHGKKVKHIYVTAQLRDQLGFGNLAIAMLPGSQESYQLVPAGVARKINQRDEGFVIQLNEKSESESETDEDDPYADFLVPDDLMW
ncbi:MAG: DUF2058 family protein [Gammaproteobacteria bacterium]|nr:DUF2058 family protein [Gammaproteobacteria bacterium]